MSSLIPRQRPTRSLEEIAGGQLLDIKTQRLPDLNNIGTLEFTGENDAEGNPKVEFKPLPEGTAILNMLRSARTYLSSAVAGNQTALNLTKSVNHLSEAETLFVMSFDKTMAGVKQLGDALAEAMNKYMAMEYKYQTTVQMTVPQFKAFKRRQREEARSKANKEKRDAIREASDTTGG